MNNPKISVIVPVYNTDKYLSKCIDSVFAQVERDFELLLIDDGSTDGSGKICDEYQAKDGRIKVFHKPNGGVSSARNVGLDNAKGEWIFFIDSDDYIDENELTIPEEYKDADVIAKSTLYSSEITDSGALKVSKISGEETSFYEDDLEIWRLFTRRPFVLNVWGKLFRRSMIGEVRFSIKDIKGEDFIFSYNILANIHKYAISDIGKYYYFQRDSSITHTHVSSLEEKFNWVFDGNKIRYFCRVPQIFTWYYIHDIQGVLRHKNLSLLSKERIASIQDFLENIEDQDCVLFTKKDFRLLRRTRNKLQLYLNHNILYKTVILRDNTLSLLHAVLHFLTVTKKLLVTVFTQRIG